MRSEPGAEGDETRRDFGGMLAEIISRLGVFDDPSERARDLLLVGLGLAASSLTSSKARSSLPRSGTFSLASRSRIAANSAFTSTVSGARQVC